MPNLATANAVRVGAVPATKAYYGSTQVWPAGGPINTVGPVITGATGFAGTGVVGDNLVCGTGTWTGTGVISYTYQWTRDNIAIGGQTTNAYTVLAGDTSGHVISCNVTAHDDVGQTVAKAQDILVI